MMKNVMRNTKTIWSVITVIIALALCLLSATVAIKGGTAFADDDPLTPEAASLIWKNDGSEIGNNFKLPYTGSDYKDVVKAYCLSEEVSYTIAKRLSDGSYTTVNAMSDLGAYKLTSQDSNNYNNSVINIEIVDITKIIWKNDGSEIADFVKLPHTDSDYKGVIKAYYYKKIRNLVGTTEDETDIYAYNYIATEKSYTVLKKSGDDSYTDSNAIMDVGEYKLTAQQESAELSNDVINIEIVDVTKVVWKNGDKALNENANLKLPKLTDGETDYLNIIKAFKADGLEEIEYTAVKVIEASGNVTKVPVESVIEVGKYEFTVKNMAIYTNTLLKMEIVEKTTLVWKYRTIEPNEDVTVEDIENYTDFDDGESRDYKKGFDYSSWIKCYIAGTTQAVTYKIYKIDGGNETQVVKLSDAGNYKLVVDHEAIYEDNTTRNFTITPIDLNLANYNILHWETNSGKQLGSGQVYKYFYNEDGERKSYYSATELNNAPNSNWQEWKYDRAIGVKFAMVTYGSTLSNSYTIKLNDENEVYYKILSYNNNTVNKDGEHTTTAKITTNGNYNLVYNVTGQANPAERGIFVFIDNGIVTITKTWYVVSYTNSVLDEMSFKEKQEISYQINDWTFGDFPASGIHLPYLKHGDELTVQDLYERKYKSDYEQRQQEGFCIQTVYLGVWNPIASMSSGQQFWYFEDTIIREGDKDVIKIEDLMTFTLYKGGVCIAENEPRSEWGYYINKYTPVGEYTVVFKSVDIRYESAHIHWYNGTPSDTGCGVIYKGISLSYDFKVKAGVLQTTKKPTDVPYEFDISKLESEGYEGFFSIANNDIEFGKFITSTDVKASKPETYWTAFADEYYGEDYSFVYNLRRMQNTNFYPADSEEWSKHLLTPGLYYVYYKVNVENYVFDDADDQENKRFLVLMYKTVADPVLSEDEFIYTGRAVTVALSTPDAAITLTADVKKDAGDYEATATLNNPTDTEYKYYRWASGGSEPKTLSYTIGKQPITRPVTAPRTYNAHAHPISINGIDSDIISVRYEDDYDDGYTTAGDHKVFIKIKEENIGNYYWVDENGNKIKDVVNGEITVIFNIKKADNGFTSAPIFGNFEWKGFKRSANTILATPKSGTVVYTVFADEACTEPIRGLERFVTSASNTVDVNAEAAFNTLECGDYYLQMDIVADDNYNPTKPFVKSFEVIKAANLWVTAPGIDNWVEGDEIPSMKGEAKYGRINFKVVDVATGVAWFSTEGNINSLDKAPVGKYLLTAWVSPADNYMGIASVTKEFSIMASAASGSWLISPSISDWIVGETAPEPIGQAAEDGTEVRYTYKTKSGEILADKPTEVGDYVLVAVIWANGKETGVTKEYSFKISPKPILNNSWTVNPSISSWIEGATASEPVGKAEVGEVKFSYKDDKGNTLSKKPTEAGAYVLVATVEADGYNVLTKEISFRIEEKEGMGGGIIAALAVLAVLVVGLAALVVVLVLKMRKKPVSAANNGMGNELDNNNTER